MDHHADYILLRELVFGESGGVRAAVANVDRVGVCGSRGAGLLLEVGRAGGWEKRLAVLAAVGKGVSEKRGDETGLAESERKKAGVGG